MKITQLDERSIHNVTNKDIERYSVTNSEDDIEDVDHTLYDEAKERLQKHIKGGKIVLFRGIELYGDPIEALLQNKNIGTSWTYNANSARVYRSTGYATEYVIAAVMDERWIDWESTLSLNMIPSRRNVEREIRLFKNTPVRIMSLYRRDRHGDLIPVDMDVVKNTIFKARVRNKHG